MALFRIALGIILLCDVVIRSADLTAFYSDEGIVSRSLLAANSELSAWCYSFHGLSGSVGFQVVLFLIAAISALCFAVGFQTRIAACVSMVLLYSIHNRNPLVLQGGDLLLRAAIFWAIFLPVGARWSIDAWRRSRNSRLFLPLEINSVTSSTVLSVASFAIVIQLVSMYLFTVLLKSDPVWWKDGTAVFYALSYDRLTTPVGIWLLENQWLMKPMTLGTYYFELLGPFLIFISWRNQIMRMLAVVLFIGFHLVALSLAMELGLFSWICTMFWFIMIPTEFWNDWLPGIIRSVRAKLEGISSGRNVVEPISAALAKSLSVIKPVKQAGRIHPDYQLKGRLQFAQSGFVGFLCIYTFLWNVRTVNHETFVKVFPEHVNWVGELTGLSQKWSMFSPTPPSTDTWEVFKAELHNGSEVDLITGLPVTWDKPALVSATYKNQRWRKFLENLGMEPNEAFRKPLLSWMSKEWNGQHEGHQTVSKASYFVVEETAMMQIQDPKMIKQLWPIEEDTKVVSR